MCNVFLSEPKAVARGFKAPLLVEGGGIATGDDGVVHSSCERGFFLS